MEYQGVIGRRRMGRNFRDEPTGTRRLTPLSAIVVGHSGTSRSVTSADTRDRRDVEAVVHGGDWGVPFR